MQGLLTFGFPPSRSAWIVQARLCSRSCVGQPSANALRRLEECAAVCLFRQACPTTGRICLRNRPATSSWVGEAQRTKTGGWQLTKVPSVGAYKDMARADSRWTIGHITGNLAGGSTHDCHLGNRGHRGDAQPDQSSISVLSALSNSMSRASSNCNLTASVK